MKDRAKKLLQLLKERAEGDVVSEEYLIDLEGLLSSMWEKEYKSHAASHAKVLREIANSLWEYHDQTARRPVPIRRLASALDNWVKDHEGTCVNTEEKSVDQEVDHG